jgi:hypothetical protein
MMSIKRFNPTYAAGGFGWCLSRHSRGTRGLTWALGSETKAALIVMNDFERIRFAMWVIPLLYVTPVVALVAYLAKSREVFVAGVVGAILGSVSPRTTVRADYSSVEGAAMAVFTEIYSHSVAYAPVGACIGVVAGACYVLIDDHRTRGVAQVFKPV